MATFPMQVGERDVSVEIADAVYPVPAVHGAVVIFIDKAYIRIERPSNGRTRIALRPKLAGATAAELKELGGSVLNELLHQALRLEVGEKTDKLRELVIGKGIMSAEATDSYGGQFGGQFGGQQGDQAGGNSDGGVTFADDPLGIARPWEEKYLGEDNGGRK